MKRILLALVPVTILATASLAVTRIYNHPLDEVAPPAEEATVVRPAAEDAAAPGAPAPETRTAPRTVVAQSEPQKPPQQVEDTAQAAAQQTADQHEEPLPELVVDRTPLLQAMAEIDRALDQAKLAVVAVEAEAQQRHIQEAVNVLAGAGEPNFRLIAGSPDSYKGVRPLLVQARVVREAAEVQWIAAVQRRSEAAAKKLAELAQAGNGAETTTPQPAPDLSAAVGPGGVLGTRGVRPEEQAQQLVERAIRQAAEALTLAARARATGGGGGLEGDLPTPRVSEEAAQLMQAVVRTLETAKKIVQIAIDR